MSTTAKQFMILLPVLDSTYLFGRRFYFRLKHFLEVGISIDTVANSLPKDSTTVLIVGGIITVSLGIYVLTSYLILLLHNNSTSYNKILSQVNKLDEKISKLDKAVDIDITGELASINQLGEKTMALKSLTLEHLKVTFGLLRL
jgi:uncharacterized protein YdcH (DUF465 family)